jgi:hypothetical protein
MEPELKIFFAKIVKSLSMAVLWMLINMTLGIFFDFGFIHSSITLGNILFYIFFLTTLSGLVWYLLKMWKPQPQA